MTLSLDEVLRKAGEIYERDAHFLRDQYKLPSAQIAALAIVLVAEFNEALKVIERRLEEKMDKHENMFGE